MSTYVKYSFVLQFTEIASVFILKANLLFVRVNMRYLHAKLQSQLVAIALFSEPDFFLLHAFPFFHLFDATRRENKSTLVVK